MKPIDPDPRCHPRFISLEGGEGVGKTSALQAIADALAERGEVVVTREPGGTPLGEDIRSLLLEDRGEPLSDHAELLMMFAARAQLVSQVIQPALARGAFVLSSRFVDSTYAYQGYGRGMDIRFIRSLDQATLPVMPGTTFLLDLDVPTGRQRVESRGEGVDRIESEDDGFFERVRTGYQIRAVAEPSRFRLVDASLPAADVRAQILRMLEAALG